MLFRGFRNRQSPDTCVVEKVVFQGLGEELELYELVELDANSELEPSDGVDGMTEATLGT